MINIWGNEELAQRVDFEIKEKKIPHTQLISDIHGNGGLLLAISIASELLGEDPLKHPDFYLCFPIIKVDKTIATSKNLIEEFKVFFKKNKYGNIDDWLNSLESKNKQGLIGVEEVYQIHKNLNLKAFKGNNKICVIWGPEFFTLAAANKILKIIEEPPSNTYFIMISEKPDQVLPTIFSRAVPLSIKKISISKIETKLNENGVENSLEIANASSGSWRKALGLYKNSKLRKNLELLWIIGLRNAFKSLGNKSIVIDLMKWAEEVSSLARNEQMMFLKLGTELVRSALVTNYKAPEASNYMSLNDFKINKLAPFINSANILDINNLLNESYINLRGNANSKILFSNFILKIAKYLNRKED